MNILDENDNQLQVEIVKSIYRKSPDGIKTPMEVKSETDWYDRTLDLSDLKKNGSIDADTVWGEMRTDLYQNDDLSYSVLWNGKVMILADDESVEGRSMFYELVDTSLDFGDKVGKENLKIEMMYDVSGDAVSQGYDGTIEGQLNISMSNKDSDIIAGMTIYADVTITILTIEQEIKKMGAIWNTPFDNKTSGVKQDETVMIDTIWGELETDVYIESEDGNTMTTYTYKDFPIKITFETGTESLKMTMDMSINNLLVNNEPATPDKIKE